MGADKKSIHRREQRQQQPSGRPRIQSCQQGDPSGTLETADLPGISDTLVCFGQPLLDMLDEDAPLEAYEYAVMIAQIAWNVEILPTIDRAVEEAATRSHDPDGLRRGIESLRRRKRALFPDDQRLIMSFHVEMRDACLYLQATSTTSHLPSSYDRPGPKSRRNPS